jgi:hypothetical protein
LYLQEKVRFQVRVEKQIEPIMYIEDGYTAVYEWVTKKLNPGAVGCFFTVSH